MDYHKQLKNHIITLRKVNKEIEILYKLLKSSIN